MEEVLKQITVLSADLKGEFKFGLTAVETKLGSAQSSIDATARSLQSMHAWWDGVDTQVSDLTVSMEALRRKVNRCGGRCRPQRPGHATRCCIIDTSSLKI
jgi:hypothetical protein